MKNKLSIVYDNWCPNCKRFISFVKFLDCQKTINCIELRNYNVTEKLKDFDLVLAKQQMASFDKKWHYGFYSLYLIFLRLPIFWILIPLLYILKITKIGQLLYEEIAIRRKIIPLHCNDEICQVDKKNSWSYIITNSK